MAVSPRSSCHGDVGPRAQALLSGGQPREHTVPQNTGQQPQPSGPNTVLSEQNNVRLLLYDLQMLLSTIAKWSG